MIGINVEYLDALIKKNSVYVTSIKDSQKKLIDSINELDECYSGRDIEQVFLVPKKERTNIKLISKVMENYLDILKDVKLSYETQDLNLKIQTTRIDPNS